MNFAMILAAVAGAAAGSVPAQKTLPGDHPIGRGEVAAIVAEQFGQIDSNADGEITVAEGEAYRRRYDSKGEFAELLSRSFEEADVDGDGRVAKWEAEHRALQIFDMVDLDQDGVASIEEQSLALALLENQGLGIELP